MKKEDESPATIVFSDKSIIRTIYSFFKITDKEVFHSRKINRFFKATLDEQFVLSLALKFNNAIVKAYLFTLQHWLRKTNNNDPNKKFFETICQNAIKVLVKHGDSIAAGWEIKQLILAEFLQYRLGRFAKTLSFEEFVAKYQQENDSMIQFYIQAIEAINQRGISHLEKLLLFQLDESKIKSQISIILGGGGEKGRTNEKMAEFFYSDVAMNIKRLERLKPNNNDYGSFLLDIKAKLFIAMNLGSAELISKCEKILLDEKLTIAEEDLTKDEFQTSFKNFAPPELIKQLENQGWALEGPEKNIMRNV